MLLLVAIDAAVADANAVATVAAASGADAAITTRCWLPTTSVADW